MRLAIVGVVFLASCIDVGFVPTDDVAAPGTLASVSGRVCSANGRTWLPDAMVYTNVTDEDGTVVDLRKAYTDRDGRWTLADLVPEREYTIQIQYGNELFPSEVVLPHAGQEIQLPEPDCFDPSALNILVVTGDYDNTQALLDRMGFTNYALIDGLDEDVLVSFFSEPTNLAQYDVIFFNGGCLERGVFWDTNPADDTPEHVAANIRDYVWNGGSVFATDWAYDIVETAWPDAIDFIGDDRVRDAGQVGDFGNVDASVTDESLADYLGETGTRITYDLPVWPPINAVEPYVSIHLTGSVGYREGESTYTLASVPLLVSFSGGSGRVAFSTFRVAANQTEDMTSIVQYVFHDLAGTAD
jgi:hypothetical protein